MNERQRRSLKAYDNAVHYFKSRPNIPRELRAVVDDLSTTTNEIRRVEVSRIAEGKRDYMAAVRRPVEKMRFDEMRPLSRLARRIFKGESKILAALRVPHKRANIEVIIDAALLMVSTLAPHRAQLAASRIDSLRLARIKKEALRLKKLTGVATGKVADKGVPSSRLRVLFAAAHEEAFAMHALAEVTLKEGDLVAYKSISRVGKRMGRPRKRRPPGAG